MKLKTLLAAAFLVASATSHAAIPDTPPIANPGGPYTIHLGEGLTVFGTGSSDPDPFDTIVSYQWDLLSNGVFDGIGAVLTFSATQLNSLGINNIGNYDLRLRVMDSFGAFGLAQTQVHVLAPEAVSTAVPEPQSLPLVLMGLGLAGVFARRRSWKRTPLI